ncbi:hypothetical protein ACFQV4_06025 [Streptomyces thermocarboxydus]
MRERVELVGGAFEGPRLDSGWHVRASMPVRTKNAVKGPVGTER